MHRDRGKANDERLSLQDTHMGGVAYRVVSLSGPATLCPMAASAVVRHTPHAMSMGTMWAGQSAITAQLVSSYVAYASQPTNAPRRAAWESVALGSTANQTMTAMYCT